MCSRKTVTLARSFTYVKGRACPVVMVFSGKDQIAGGTKVGRGGPDSGSTGLFKEFDSIETWAYALGFEIKS